MTEASKADEVYRILMAECGAPEDDYGFAHHWPECNEWRFIGNQGFGGKVWAGSHGKPPYVTCYPEDDNEDRRVARSRANARLAALGSVR